MIHRTITSLVSIATLSSIAYASEVVRLNNGNSFSGNIANSDTPSVIHLMHPFAETPIKLRESSIQQIKFKNDSLSSKYSEIIQLINGDRFHCNITSINQEGVSLNSSTLGSHIIKRDQVSKITFNTKYNKAVYSGPGDDLSAWTTTDERWSLKDGTLSVADRSEASIQIPSLTKNYILKFSTKRDQISPMFRFCFSGNNQLADKKSDHYYVDFNSHGMSLQRSKNGQYDSLAQILSNHEVFDKDVINVTIYVDRKQQKLALYLNEELIKIIAETKHETAPEGNFLVIKNLQLKNHLTQISDINIYEWKGQVNEDSEKSATSLKKHDLITDLNGSIITGDILSIAEDDSSALTFKAPFAKSDSTIPKSSLDVLEFKRAKENTELSETNFLLTLTSGGKLNYTKSQFVDSQLKLEHPILGSISIPKTTIKSLTATPQEVTIDDEK